MRLIAPSYRLFRRATVSLDTGRAARGLRVCWRSCHGSRTERRCHVGIVPEQSPHRQLSGISETSRPRERPNAPAAGARSRRLQYPSKNSVDFWCFSRTSVKSASGGNRRQTNALAAEVARHQTVPDRPTFAFNSTPAWAQLRRRSFRAQLPVVEDAAASPLTLRSAPESLIPQSNSNPRLKAGRPANCSRFRSNRWHAT
jgi:hypothetical protein